MRCGIGLAGLYVLLQVIQALITGKKTRIY